MLRRSDPCGCWNSERASGDNPLDRAERVSEVRSRATARQAYRQVRQIITAAGVSAGIDLALLVVGEICGRERAEVVQLLIEYDPQPPFKSGHPTKASKAVFAAASSEMQERSRNSRNVLSVPSIVWRNTINKVRNRFGS